MRYDVRMTTNEITKYDTRITRKRRIKKEKNKIIYNLMASVR